MSVKKSTKKIITPQGGVEETSTINTWIVVLISGVIILVVVLAYAFYNQLKTTSTLIKTKDMVLKESTNSLIMKVGRLIELPIGEEPTIATVSDKTKLGGQPFFAKAENGDRVFIYTKAKKAILYRPLANKIIEVAPINIADTSLSSSSSSSVLSSSSTSSATIMPTITKTVSVAVYNATKKAGYASEVGQNIMKEIRGVELGTTSNTKEDYTSNLIIDLTGGHDELVQKLITLLSGEKRVFPIAEIKPDTDILVILGK
jgi:hypothetical protein